MKKFQILTSCSKALCVGVFSTLIASCGNNGATQQSAPPVQVKTMSITLGTANLEKEYPATIKGEKDTEIRPQVSGFITKVCVDEGQQVHQGQVLFVLDQVQLEAAVRSAEAAVESAKSAVATQELTTQNKKKLYEKNIISDYEYQTAVLSLESAKAGLNQAEESLINARKSLSFANVTSPIDGVVGNIPLREGSLVGPSGQALTTVSNISNVYAYFSFNEKDILELTNNGEKSIKEAIAELPEVYFKLSNGAKYALSGNVSTVSGVLNQTTGAATVRAIFKNTNGMLRSGSTGTILIPQPCDNAIIIPQNATYEIQNMRFVYLVDESNKAVSTPITVNPVNDGKTFVVTSGLNAGDVIVIEGVGTRVKDGTTIAPSVDAQ